MGLAETAKLAVELNLSGNFSSALPKAEQQFASLNRTTTGVGSRLTGAFGTAGVAAGKFGGALGHAGSQIKNLITGPLGILGLTGGLLGFGGAIESSLAKASSFSLALERLTGLTGESAQSMGELILVAGKFGVESDRLAQIVGFTEKRLGLLQNTSAGAAKGGISLSKAQEEVTKAHERLGVATQKLSELEAKGTTKASALEAAHFRVADADRALIKAQDDLAHASSPVAASLNKLQELGKQYGVVLTDGKGKALDFSTVLNNVADYYSSNATAANKAALASQVFGRGFAVMIPILQLGSKGINNAKQAVEDLGLSLGTDTQGALAAYKTALRGVGEAIDVLQIEIGLALAPAITDLANSITVFLEHGGAKQIVGFFKEGAKFAQGMGKVVQDDVLPIFGAIKAGWDTVPDDFKKLIIGGAILGKTTKFLFGFGPIDILKGVGGAFFSRGSPVNPMWVKQVGLPVGGGGGVPIPGGGGLSGLAKVALVGEAIGLIAVMEAVREGISDRNSRIAGEIQDQTKQYLAQTPSKADLLNSLGAVDKGIADIRSNPLNVLVQGDALTKLEEMRAAIQKQLDLVPHTAAQRDTAAKEFDAGAINDFNDQSPAMIRAFQSGAMRLAALVSPLTGLIATLKAAKGDAAIVKAADALAAAVKAEKGRGTLTAGTAGLGVKELRDSLVALQAKQAAALKAGNTALAAALGKDIKAVERKLPERAFVAKELATEERILRSTEKSGDKLRDLTGIQRALQQHGDTKAAAIVSRAIADMKNRLAKTTAQAGEVAAAAIRHKKQMIAVNIGPTTIPVTVNVSARQVRTAEVVVQRYGTNRIGWT